MARASAFRRCSIGPGSFVKWVVSAVTSAGTLSRSAYASIRAHFSGNEPPSLIFDTS